MRQMLSLLALAVIHCAIWNNSVAAQEWVRFRGPNGSGVSEATTIPAQWTEKDINWKTTLPGMGHSSPVLWGNRIFLLSAEPDTAKRYVLGLNAGDGQIVWKREFPGVVHPLHALSSYASCTPTVDEKRVYVAWSDPLRTVLTALDHSGNDVWSADLGPWVSMHGFGTSPILYEDLVILFCSQEAEKGGDRRQPKESFVVAVDRETGTVRWRTPRKIDNASFSVPCLHKTSKGKMELLCCSTAEGIFSLDPQTGAENWSEQAFKLRTVSSPVLVGEMVIGTTGKGGGSGNTLVAVKLGPKPELAYEVTSKVPYVPTPVAKGDLLFLWSDSGMVSCLQTSDGSEVWNQRLGGVFYGSPVCVGDKLFCVEDAGTVICLSASDTFQELGRFDLKDDCRSTPAIAGGKMYVRTFSHLFCVGGKK